MYFNKNEIVLSSDEEKKNNDDLNIFNNNNLNKGLTSKKDIKESTNHQNLNKITRHMSEKKNDTGKINSILSSINNVTISNTNNDKFNIAQKILEVQKERMNTIHTKTNFNINLIQNNIPRDNINPIKHINENFKINRNLSINLNTEPITKQTSNINILKTDNISPNKRHTDDIRTPSIILKNTIEQQNDVKQQENDFRIFEENKLDNNDQPTSLHQNVVQISDNDPKNTLFNHIIASPIKPLSFEELKQFLTSAVPEGKILQCNILRKRTGMERLYPKYFVSINNNEKFLMAARKRPNNTTPNYLITMDNENFEKDKLCLGKLRSNFMGTEFQIYDTGKNPNDTKNFDDLRVHLGCVKYKTNFFGLKGPRKMKIYIPFIDDNGNTFIYKPINKNQSIVSLYKKGDKQNVRVYINKQPKWSEKHQAFVLNFNGRVERGSVKNFQLVDENDDEKVILQFGRLNDNLFSMDFASPLSPFQAFAICLSSLDSKFACE